MTTSTAASAAIYGRVDVERTYGHWRYGRAASQAREREHARALYSRGGREGGASVAGENRARSEPVLVPYLYLYKTNRALLSSHPQQRFMASI